MVVLVVHELRMFACTSTCCVAADCLYSVSSACLVATIFIIPAAVVFHKPALLLPRVESACPQQRNFVLYIYCTLYNLSDKILCTVNGSTTTTFDGEAVAELSLIKGTVLLRCSRFYNVLSL
jgi:hypothetical protein